MTSKTLLSTAVSALLLLTACKDDSPAPAPAGEAPAESAPAQVDASKPTETHDVMVLSGGDGLWEWMESDDGWAGVAESPERGVPYVLFTAVHDHWAEASKSIPVQQKKLIFYRSMLPLILHANHMVHENRAKVLAFREQVAAGESLNPEALSLLARGLELFRVTDADTAAELDNDTAGLPEMMDELLLRLDEIPAGLALGQSAYESGYGTSRFALQGNALFGQASFDAGGMKATNAKPLSEGGHHIAAFDWPFDSVRGYFINLNSHPAYEDFRRLRAEQRAAGEPLDSLKLADGLLRYSTRGQDYIDDLKGIIRHNGLDRADAAELRKEQKRFMLVAEDDATKAQMEAELEEMRASGELRAIYERMRLD